MGMSAHREPRKPRARESKRDDKCDEKRREASLNGRVVEKFRHAAATGLRAGTGADWLVRGTFGGSPSGNIKSSKQRAKLDYSRTTTERGCLGPVRMLAHSAVMA
jgi:hypothetical protein